MRIFVTGGTGFIGRHWIASRPLDEFTVLTRQSQPNMPMRNVDFVHNLDALKSLDEFDVVVNLAGEAIVGQRWSAGRKLAIRESRLAITQALVTLISQSDNPPERFVSGSAIGVYGDTGQEAVTEATTIVHNRNDFAQSLCLEWEAVALAATPYTAVSLLRTGIVLGADGGALQKMLPAFRWGLGGRLGAGRQFMSWIHLSDVVRAINFIIDGVRFSGPINLTAPNPVSNRLFTAELAQACRRPGVFAVPALLLKAALGEASQLLLDSQRILPGNLLERQFYFEFVDLPSALNDLI